MNEKLTQEPGYDPAHLAAMILIVLAVITILFWLLWTLLVYQGGIFSKIMPALKILLGKKTLQDYGWAGYPYQMGIFSGFIANTIAAVLTMTLVLAIGWVLTKSKNLDSRPVQHEACRASGNDNTVKKEEEKSNEAGNQ
jgi:hypothetical protein